MVWKRGGAERGYHHGNLKEALMRAALDLIAQKGPAGFTFADAARCAGVSPAAPYRHYRDRDDLLSDVARRGFEEFEQQLANAWDDGKPDPQSRLRAARQGLSRLRARRSPPSIRRCSRPAFRSTPVRNCARPAIAPSRWCAGPARRSRRCCRQDKRPPALMMALHIWAFSHGIASLFARGDGAKRSLPMTAEDLLEAGVLVYLSGLGLHGESLTGTRKPRGLTAKAGAVM